MSKHKQMKKCPFKNHILGSLTSACLLLFYASSFWYFHNHNISVFLYPIGLQANKLEKVKLASCLPVKNCWNTISISSTGGIQQYPKYFYAGDFICLFYELFLSMLFPNENWYHFQVLVTPLSSCRELEVEVLP